MVRRLLSLLAITLAISPGTALAQRDTRAGPRMLTANECIGVDVSNMGTGSVQVTGVSSATVTWTVSADNANFVAIDAFAPDTPGSAANSTTSNGVWTMSVAGLSALRACVGASGSATVTLRAVGTGGGGSGGGGGGGAGTSDTTETTQLAVLDAVDGLEGGVGAAADAAATQGSTGTISAKLRTVTAQLNTIASALAGTLVVGDGSGALNVIIDSSATLTVASHAVTNAGTFAVQVDGNALTALQLIDNLVSVEDAVAGSGWSGVGILAVRQDSHADLAADGDFIPVTVDADGGLRVSIVSGASSGTAYDHGEALTVGSANGTVVGGRVSANAPSTTGVADDDFALAWLNPTGSLNVVLRNASGTELTPSSDATFDSAFSSTGPQLMIGAADFDGSALPNAVSAEGDAARAVGSLNGVLYMMPANEDGSKTPLVDEDVASAAADLLMKIGAIRDDTLDARSGTEGDWEMLHLNAAGALWVVDVNSAAELTSTQLLDDTVFVDDAAFTPGTSTGFAVGFQADDTSTDSVDEGDFGVPRMSLDRLIYTRTIDPCSGVAKTHIPINISTATTTELTPALAGASTHYYICSIDLVTGGADNVALTDDDSDNCGSVTSGLAGGTSAASGWNFPANGGLTKGNGSSTVFKTGGTNRVVCLVTSAAVQLSGSIQVVAAP